MLRGTVALRAHSTDKLVESSKGSACRGLWLIFKHCENGRTLSIETDRLEEFDLAILQSCSNRDHRFCSSCTWFLTFPLHYIASRHRYQVLFPQIRRQTPTPLRRGSFPARTDAPAKAHRCSAAGFGSGGFCGAFPGYLPGCGASRNCARALLTSSGDAGGPGGGGGG